MPSYKKPGVKWQHLLLLITTGFLFFWLNQNDYAVKNSPTEVSELITSKNNFSQLVKQQLSGAIVEVSADVYKILKDDNEGSRHQRFLVYIEGISVLVAHNIDLAPRVPLKVGDNIRVKGEYEWNDKGGVIHWTHHDPKKWREDGWIEYQGKKFK